MGVYTLPPLQSAHVRNVYPPPSAVCAFSEPILFRFRVQATRVVFVFRVTSGHACSLVGLAVRSYRRQ